MAFQDQWVSAGAQTVQTLLGGGPGIFPTRPTATSAGLLNRLELQEALGVFIQRIDAAFSEARDHAVSRLQNSFLAKLEQKIQLTEKFDEWERSSPSKVLILQASEPVQLDAPTMLSGIGLVSHSIISFRHQQPPRNLEPCTHYFCGVFRNDSANNRFHLLRSLIIQMLERRPAFAMTCVGRCFVPLFNGGIGSFDNLVYLFKIILQSILGTVSCVIDGSAHFPDDDEHEKELQFMSGALLNICRANRPDARLKLLFTPPIVKCIRDSIPEEMQVIITSNAEPT